MALTEAAVRVAKPGAKPYKLSPMGMGSIYLLTPVAPGCGAGVTPLAGGKSFLLSVPIPISGLRKRASCVTATAPAYAAASIHQLSGGLRAPLPRHNRCKASKR